MSGIPLSVVLALACTEPPLQPADGASPPLPQATPTSGITVVSTPTGGLALHWKDVGGWAIAEGDIVVGRTAEVALQERGTPHDDLGRRWPDGEVTFTIDPAMPGTANIYAAIANWEAVAPVQFIEDPTPTGNYVRFAPPPAGDPDTCFSEVGMTGGEQLLQVASWCLEPGITHELGHVLGLWHEQSRTDRDDYITVDLTCVDASDHHNFDRHDHDSWAHGPYDYSSIMHYNSFAFVVQGCTTPSILKTDGSTIGSITTLSAGDISAINTLYGSIDTNEVYEEFGTVLASGDFNDDGFPDIAVGAPGASSGVSRTGTVVILLGTIDGPALWQVLDPDVTDWGDSWDFGAALAAGDLDNDGDDDLIVGAPGDPVGSVNNAGRIYLFNGGPTGLTPNGSITQGQSGLSLDEQGDNFGAALAMGDFDADGDVDLVVGAPGEKPGGSSLNTGYLYEFVTINDWPQARRLLSHSFAGTRGSDRLGSALAVGDFNGDGRDDLAAGAPNYDGYSRADSGGVFIYHGSGNGLTNAYRLSHKSSDKPDAGAHFGAALAAGALNGDGKTDLAVGAPDRNGYGAVYAYRHKIGSSNLSQAFYLDQVGLGTNEVGDRYGASVAIGTLNNPSGRTLVVGAPGEAPSSDPASGLVFVWKVSGNPSPWVTIDQTGLGSNELDDAFGSSLLIADVVGGYGVDLLIGAPGESPGSDPNAGAAFLFEGRTGGVSPTAHTWFDQEHVQLP